MLGQPEARERMKVLTERHVELFCDLPLVSFLAPVAYNVALILLAAVYGFLTRKLPENYNESWYIFIYIMYMSSIGCLPEAVVPIIPNY